MGKGNGGTRASASNSPKGLSREAEIQQVAMQQMRSLSEANSSNLITDASKYLEKNAAVTPFYTSRGDVVTEIRIAKVSANGKDYYMVRGGYGNPVNPVTSKTGAVSRFSSPEKAVDAVNKLIKSSNVSEEDLRKHRAYIRRESRNSK